MVKNKKGGSGHKRQARKHTTDGGIRSNKTRFSNDPYEIYAICTKLYGGGNVGVFCQDGKDRLCILRKKFKGRGKRDNTVSIGIYLLVGIREFENRNTNKQEKCDLLEVYSDHDKKVLEQTVSNVNWGIFKSINYCTREGTMEDIKEESYDGVEFSDDKTMEYETLLTVDEEKDADEEDADEEDADEVVYTNVKNTNVKNTNVKNTNNIVIDIDDI